MKTDISLKLLGLSVIGLILSPMTSCINEDYSLENLDTTVTLIPGINVDCDIDADLGLIEVLNQYGGVSTELTTDEKGNYIIVPRLYYGTGSMTFSREQFRSGSVFNFDTIFNFCLQDLVFDAFANGDGVFCPIYLELNNPTDSPLFLRLTVYDAHSNERKAVDGIAVKPGKSTVILDQEEVTGLYGHPTGSFVYIQEIELYKDANSLTASQGNEGDDYVFTISPYIPVGIKPGQSFSYRKTSMFFSSLGLDEYISRFGNFIRKVTVDVSVTSSLPFDLDLTQYTTDDPFCFKGSIAGMKTIAAGTLEKPVTTDMTLEIDAPDGFDFEVSFLIDGKVPQSMGAPVFLNENQNLNFHITSIKF